MMNRDIIKSPHEQKLCGEWETQPLRKISTIVGGGTPRRSKVEFWENGNIPWLVPSEISSGNATFIHDTEEHINQRGLSSSSAKLMPAGSVLMTSRATIGECIINTVPMATNQGFSNFICDEDVLDNLFLLYQLRYRKKQLISLAGGSTFLEISKSSIRSFNMLVPPLPEQKKIAAILSSVDEAIQKTDEVIEQTKQLKKGLMQELLTRGIGHSEFEEVRIGPHRINTPNNWEVRSMDELASSEKHSFVDGPFGSNLLTDDYREDGDIRLVQLQNIAPFQFIDSEKRYTYTRKYREQIRSAAKPGDIVLAKMPEPIGRACMVPSIEERYLVVADVIKFTPGCSLNPKYAICFFNSHIFHSQVASHATGSTRLRLNLSSFKELKVLVPSQAEQERIATILCSIERKIRNQEDYKSQLQLLKKGLMQVLLTGKVRVKID